MEIGEVVSGYENQDGITLNIIHEIDEILGTTGINVKLFEPDDQDFAWAVEQLALL